MRGQGKDGGHSKSNESHKAGTHHGLTGASSLNSALRASPPSSYLVVPLEGREGRQEILQGYFCTLD